jgi:hypothetical protein
MARANDRRLREILVELSSIGEVLPGSISRRYTRCQRDGCHCHKGTSSLHGPYLTWTWKLEGTAVTKTLSEEEFARLKPYSEAHRRLKQLVSELEVLSLEVIEETERVKLGRATRVGKGRVKAGRRTK